MDTVGDLARTLILRTHHTRLNRDLDRLGVEIATGFVRDPTAHLGGDVNGLLAIDRTLAQLETYRVNTTEAGFLTSSMQTALEEMQNRSEHLSQVLLSSELTPTDDMLQTMSSEAENALGQVLNGLNRNVGGRFLFSGAATDRPAIIGADAMLTGLRTALTGQTTAAGVNAALDTWFDGVGGGFDTNAYLGSGTSLSPFQLSRTETAGIDIRANDQVFRDILKATAKAVLASDPTLALSTDVKVDLLAEAGQDLITSQESMVELRASLGTLEARIEETTTRNSAERTATSIARLDLVGIDDFETASRYENTRAQLESLYAITVRSSRMSLTEFL